MSEMTPDKFYAETLGKSKMSEMTPEKLRKLAHKTDHDQEYGSPSGDDLRAAASAWEADRKRLEEAMWLIEHCEGPNETDSGEEQHEWNRRCAALAAEDKP